MVGDWFALKTPPPLAGAGPLTAEDVIAVARVGVQIELAADARAAIRRGREIVDALACDTEPHYGISTGFGALATRHIPVEQRTQLQASLIRSHAAGSGPEVEHEVVRALMLLRLATLRDVAGRRCFARRSKPRLTPPC